jgi:hypothetical protein
MPDLIQPVEQKQCFAAAWVSTRISQRSSKVAASWMLREEFITK